MAGVSELIELAPGAHPQHGRAVDNAKSTPFFRRESSNLTNSSPAAADRAPSLHIFPFLLAS